MSMKVIYKYEMLLEAGAIHNIQMPEGAIMYIGPQETNSICIWMSLPLGRAHPTINRKFEIVGTGNDYDDENRNYIGSVQQKTQWGEFVWHVFEVTE